jgi:hypothetical protein
MRNNVIDYTHVYANMYGCLPCPKCKSRYRVPMGGRDGKPLIIQCDDCKHTEDMDEESAELFEEE